jgi:hypothetical protein
VYSTLIYSDPPTINAGDGNANITSSRVCTAAVTPSMLMQRIMADIATAGGRGSAPRYEADKLCYRYKVLPNVYATEILNGAMPSLTNGYFRMHPILLQGVPTFDVMWTDGSTDVNNNTLWYGLRQDGTLVPSGTAGINQPALANGDNYTVIFSYDTPRNLWPKALRFHYRVTDPNNRLNGGRDFVQVVKVPD